MATHEPAVYDVKLADAAGASASVPGGFPPKQHRDGYGFVNYEIDGMMIANNPAFYAYQTARLFNKKKNIRMLSLGTGVNPFTPYKNTTHFQKIDYLKKLLEFVTNMDDYTA